MAGGGLVHHPLQCFPVRDIAVFLAYCDAVGDDALNGASVDVQQNLRRQKDFLRSPQEEEAGEPREVLGDGDTQKLKAGETLILTSR